MNASDDVDFARPSGDELVLVLRALSNPNRLRILTVLARGRVHVSQLARVVRLSRPLVHMHLQRLEAAGLVTSHLELSDEGRAMKFYETTPFVLHVTPEAVADAARTLKHKTGRSARREHADRKLAEETAEAHRATIAELEKATVELAALRKRTTEPGHVPKEVE